MKDKEKKVKMPKEKKSKKQMPEGYIGRPKPMKVKKFEFKKPTLSFYIWAGVWTLVIGFIVFLAISLVSVKPSSLKNVVRYDFKDAGQPESYVIENSKLKFEMNPYTTLFTVTQKDTGHVWYSSPEGALTDPLALSKEKQNMKSPFLLKYSTENGVDTLYDLSSSSIDKKVYEILQKTIWMNGLKKCLLRKPVRLQVTTVNLKKVLSFRQMMLTS